MSFHLSPIGNDQQFDANGDPLNGGKIYTYLAGTTTPVATYTDDTGVTPQANPIILNSLGAPASPIWLTGGVTYKFVIKDANDVTLRTIDDISGINDFTSNAADEWTLYGSSPTYTSATSFTLVGDQTLIFQVGRRLKSANTGGTIYSSILTSVYSAPNTTVTVVNDSGSLDAGMSAVSYALLNATNPSVPYQYAKKAEIQAQTYTAFTTGGTSSAFTLTPAPAITAYAENQTFDVEFNAASTGTPTLNISAVGAKSLKYRDALGALVTCGTLIPSGWRSKVTYDGTDMIVREMPTAVITVGQGRMTKVGSDLVFARYQGRFLTANGVVYEIPSGGVTIAPTSNTANTTYYQYAVISAGAISSTGEYSATGYTVGSDGVAYKTGDTSRVMVGMARSGTSGGTWSSIATEVRSWFNRGTLTADTEITTTLTVTAAASSTEFANGGTPVRGGLVCFADDMVRAEAKLVVGHSSTSVYTNVSIGVDGGSALVGTMDPQNDYDTTNNNYPRYVYGQANLSEGWHDVRIYGYQTSGTFTIAPGSGTAGERPRITVTVSGG